MKHLYLCAALALSSMFMSMAMAQSRATLPEQVKAMKACAFLSGHWSGKGWYSMGAGQKMSFHGTVEIEPQLGGLLLLVKARQGKDAAGKTMHEMFAVLSFDPEDKKYHFRAYQQMGYYDAIAQCGNNSMSWTSGTGPTHVQYTVSLTPKGQWHEVVRLTPPGAPPQTVFETTLDKAR